MASSDYTIRAEGTLAPSGVLSGAIGHLETSITLSGFKGTAPSVGMPAIIGGEIVKIVSADLPNLTIARGCADTIPAAHAAGARVWFLSPNIPVDAREYTGGDTIGVKGLPFTLGGGTVPIPNAPPMTLTFNWRFARPYAPGNVKCDGVAWCDGPHVLELGATELTFTWAHRDRVLQSSMLVDHTSASIGPEPGTTYIITVLDDAETPVRTVVGITGTTWEYTKAMMVSDLPNEVGFVELFSRRDGLDSWQKYRAAVMLRMPGLGEALGENLGGGY